VNFVCYLFSLKNQLCICISLYVELHKNADNMMTQFLLCLIFFVALTELMRGPFNGCKSLDISDNVLVDEEKSLSLWISRDTSLRNLNISSLDNKDTVLSMIDAAAGMSEDLFSLTVTRAS